MTGWCLESSSRTSRWGFRCVLSGWQCSLLSAQGTRPVALALAAPDTDGGPTWPCGACLQVGLELGGPDMLVVVGDNKGGPVQQSTIGELLPRGPHVNV